MMKFLPGATLHIAVTESVLMLIRMENVVFGKRKDIYRRQKGIGQMAYMREGLIMRLSGAFYIYKKIITGPWRIGFGPFFV